MEQFLNPYEKPMKKYAEFNCGRPLQIFKKQDGVNVEQLFMKTEKQDEEIPYLLKDIQQQEEIKQTRMNEILFRDEVNRREADAIQAEERVRERDELLTRKYEMFEKKLKLLPNFVTADQREVLKQEFIKTLVNDGILENKTTLYNHLGEATEEDIDELLHQELDFNLKADELRNIRKRNLQLQRQDDRMRWILRIPLTEEDTVEQLLTPSTQPKRSPEPPRTRQAQARAVSRLASYNDSPKK